MKREVTSDLLCAFGLILFVPALILENHVVVGVACSSYLLGFLMDPDTTS